MIKVPRLAALGLCIALAGCATDKYSFIRYGQSVDPSTGQYDARRDPVLTDVLALNYASSVAAILRAKYTGARITRELSSTAQIGLAAAAGYGAAFHYSASTLAILGLGSAGIPELQRVFGAKERAQTYQDATRLIEEAEIEYLSLNQQPSPDFLTQNGVTLLQRVTASIHVVEKTLAGNLPSVEDMQKATERMSQDGAVETAPGAPAFNNLPANADSGTAASLHTPPLPRRFEATTISAREKTTKENAGAIQEARELEQKPLVMAMRAAKSELAKKSKTINYGAVLTAGGYAVKYGTTRAGYLEFLEKEPVVTDKIKLMADEADRQRMAP